MKTSSSAQDLWVNAFTKLEAEDVEVLRKHETQIAELNNILINKALYEKKLKQWCVTLAGKSLNIREIGAKIINFVSSSQSYMAQVASVEPHAALAWTCVSLLLPLISNQSSQEEAMLAGLDEVSYLIGFYSTWEELHTTKDSDKLQETVTELYCAILTYQARMLRYLSRNSISKFGRDAIKKDAWEAWLAEVRIWDKRCVEHGKLEDISQERHDRTNQVFLLETQVEITKHMLAALSDMNQQRLRQISKSERTKLLECFSKSNDYRKQKDVNPKRVEGTCEWFVRDEKFKNFCSSQTSCLLHVFAGPGCGKSVLIRSLVDSRVLRSSDSVTVLYFFFKAAQGRQDRCADAVAAMLHQLYTQEHTEGMIEHAMRKFEAHGENLPTMFQELWDILQRTVEDATAGEIVCVFDALDECLEEDRRKLLTTVTGYFEDVASLQKAGGRLKVLITSRPYGNIINDYAGLETGAPVVQLDGNDKIELIAKEINLVIDFEVSRALPRAPRKIQRQVIEQLQSMDNRTYLWLHLVLDHIKKNSAGKQTPKKISQLISNLPKTVNETYSAMLQRSKDPLQAKILLHLIIAAKRPLTVSELKIAAELVKGDYSLYQDLYDETESPEQFKTSLQDICGLMLAVHDSQVYFIHKTARDYLCENKFTVRHEQIRWQGPLVIGEAETLIAQCCISMLELEDFSSPLPWKGLAMEPHELECLVDHWAKQYGFLEYAAMHWASHARATIDAESPVDLQNHVRLCDPTSEVFWAWYPVFCHGEHRKVSDNEHSLVIASSVGLESLTRLLLRHGADVNVQNGNGMSALHVASEQGYREIVQLLLDEGADVNVQNGDGNSALHNGIGGDCREIVQLLLDKGADIDAQNEFSYSALQAASLEGYYDIVKLLLGEGANANIQGGFYNSALQAASRRGHLKVAQLLLLKGADVNIQAGYYGSALQAASIEGDYEIVQLLLNEGAEVNAQGRLCGSALEAATERKHRDIVQLLLDEGANAGTSVSSRPEL